MAATVSFVETRQSSGFFATSGQRLFIAAMLITAFSVATFFIGLGTPALWDRDEPTYASAALEMRAANDWLTPTIKGEPFLDKPILMYWLVLASYHEFGVDEFSSRLPSAIFGLLASFTIFFIARALWGYGAGVYSAIVFSTSLLPVVVSRLLVPDAALTFFTAVAFAFYLRAKARLEWRNFFLGIAYAAVGLGILSKGPIALFPVAVFLLDEWLAARRLPTRSFPRRALRHFYFLSLALAIAAPWFAYEFYTHEKFMERFFLHENFSRFANVIQGHSGGVMYYIPVLVFGMFPWSCFLIASLLAEAKKGRRRGEAGVLLLLLWIAVPLIALSLSATKLPHYLLILFPAFACLTGKFLQECGGEGTRAFKISVVATALFTFFIMGALFAAGLITSRYDPEAIVFPFIALFGFLLVSVSATLEGRLLYARLAALGGAGVFFIGLSLISLPYIESLRVMRPIALAAKAAAGSGGEIYRYGVSEPSIFFYSGHYFSVVKKGELDSILDRPWPVYIVTRKDKLLQAQPKTAYTVVAEKDGFSENGGAMTLLLIRNSRG